MKTFLLTTLTTIFFISSLTASTIIDLQILGGANTQVQIYEPVEGKFTFTNAYYVNTDENGKLTLAPQIRQAGFVYVFLNYLPQNQWNAIQIYIEPESYLEVSFQRDRPMTTLQFSGVTAVENNFLNRQLRSAPILTNSSQIIQALPPLNQPNQIEQKVLEMRRMNLEQLESFSAQNALSLPFINDIKEDIHYYHTYLFHQLWRLARALPDYNYVAIDWERIETNMISEKAISNDQALSSFWYHHFLQGYYQEYLPLLRQEQLATRYYKISDYPSRIEAIFNDYLRGETREYALGDFIFQETFNENLAPTLSEIYLRMRQTYPDHPTLSFLQEAMAPVLQHQGQSETQKVVYMDEYLQTGSLKNLLNQFPNQLVYIDIWASWCGPCKEQFKYNDDFAKYAKGREIVKLYISIDEPDRAPQWRSNINQYKLYGHHVHARGQLLEEVKRVFGMVGLVVLPTYSISKNGEILAKKANGPSSKEKLYEQLEGFLY